MNTRERIMAVLNYQPYDRLPIVNFGYWVETLEKWAAEGHITEEQARSSSDGNEIDYAIGDKLGFDFNWATTFGWTSRLFPPIERRVVEERPDGTRVVLDENGAYIIEKTGIVSIPTEVDHILKSRKEWDEFFKPRLQFTMERITGSRVCIDGRILPFEQGGLDLLKSQDRSTPYGLYCGSLVGVIRDWLGLVNMSYLMADNPALFDEMIEVVAELCYQGVEAILETGARFEFGHFWEDMCYKGGPLISPRVFTQKAGPHYRRITDLMKSHGVTLVSLDCDGKIDKLVSIWLENGVNIMFPIEVGTWNASIRPWREQYGPELRGVGGVRKAVFALDYAAVEAEIERLRPLVELGGYIPCPDHRIPSDAKWENIQYYCERLRKLYG
ncbi:MAG: hypothetical protein JW850_20180 [Thermoflexales bacterium]|nr:hypothetical protein [Thermoflexales bacterium]